MSLLYTLRQTTLNKRVLLKNALPQITLTMSPLPQNHVHRHVITERGKL